MNLLSSLPDLFWLVIAFCAVALLALWWFVLGAPRAARRRALRRRIDALGPAGKLSEATALGSLRQAIAHAKDVLQQAPTPTGEDDGLYVIPWFLFIGDTAADVPGLLAAAHSVSPLPLPEGADDRPDHAFWRWWFLESMTAIETSPAAVCDNGTPRARSLWYHALMELAEQRDRLPLNGIVVCVSTSSLLGDAAAIEPCAARLRHLVDEAAEHLQLHLPVYLIVTGLQRLVGYETVRDALPPAVLDQVLGHRLPADTAHAAQRRNPNAKHDDDALSELFAPIALRLQGLRMSLLHAETTPAGRQAIHTFFAQLHALQPGLRRVVNRIFEEPGGRHPPHWRGLYLTGVQPEAGGIFVSDLFKRFLPADQPLAHS